MRKFISMLCAIMMVFSLMTAGMATTYKDEALISAEYETAVDVMSAIGVFNGNNGNLYPKDTLTRAEAAKVIAYFSLTKDNAERLGTSNAPFTDVPADLWAAASIAYCKNLDIVSGKGNNMYDPQGTLTGFELAKMLLVVAGYGDDKYKGEGWNINVNLDALNAGLLADLDGIDLSKPILREQAIQMSFNALAVDMVKVTGGSNITIGDLVISTGGTITKTGKTVAEFLYPDLHCGDVESDEFGYNVKAWTFKGKEVAIDKAYTVLATYTTDIEKVTGKMVAAVLGGAGTYPVVKNGEAETAIAITKDDTKVFADYKGDTITLVKNDDDTKEIIIAHPEVVEITKVNKATETDKRSVVAGAYTIETDAYAEGDYIIVYANEDKVLNHEAADFVYGTVTQTNKTTNTIYIDGVAYPVVGDVAVKPGEKYTAYMSNGYILAADTEVPTVVEAPAEFIYVYRGGQLRGEYVGGSGKFQVEYYDMNGVAKKMLVDREITESGLYKIVGKNTDGEAAIQLVTDKYAINKAANAVSITFDGTKAYFTKNTKVLAVGDKAATVLPISDRETNYGECWVIYRTIKDTTINEVDMIITTSEIVTAAPTTTDLYYTNGIDTGSIVIGEKVYKTYEICEIATAKRFTIAADKIYAGFNYLSEIKNGVYSFIEADPIPALYEGKMTAYNTLISIGDLEDADASNAIVLNLADNATLSLNDLTKKNNVSVYIIFDEEIVKTIIVVDFE